MGLIKILCHTCEGEGFIDETEYKTHKLIKILCPECSGRGWVAGQGYLSSNQTMTKEKTK